MSLFAEKTSTDNELLEQFDLDHHSSGGWLRAIFEFIVETIKVLILAAAIILPIRYFLIQPFYVKGASMEPNFYDHEYLMINEISYRFTLPVRGEIVVFRYPRDPSQFFIKRVIGLPGETIIIEDGQIFIIDAETNEKWILDESNYIIEGAPTALIGKDRQSILEDDEYYLLGDNRTHSLDSRNFGPVKQSLIIGKVWFRGWPLNRIEIFD